MAKRRKKIEWKLLTDLSVQSRKDAVEKIEWYALRWKIEVFHKVLKSGCSIEQRQLASAANLQRALALYSVIAWRLLSVTLICQLMCWERKEKSRRVRWRRTSRSSNRCTSLARGSLGHRDSTPHILISITHHLYYQSDKQVERQNHTITRGLSYSY